MKRIREIQVAGCFELVGVRHRDIRGDFTKVLDRRVSEDCRMPEVWSELFYSTSLKGVVRGLHFQCPPFAGAKLVSCVAGSAFDVVVDLRKDSPTFGEWHAVLLSETEGNALFVPMGCAHGFQALSDRTMMLYMQEMPFDEAADAGVRFDSLGVQWPIPISHVSPRDRQLPRLPDFHTPF